MYRHRPAFPAIVGAFASLLIGVFCFFMIYQRVQSGEIGPEKISALVLISISVSGIFFIAAFARYQFTHLWVKPRRKTRTRRRTSSADVTNRPSSV